MNKSSFFTGQPVFNQVLNFIPRKVVAAVVQEWRGDHYYKSFRTYDHLVTMLYAVFNQCTCIREVTTGLMAWDQRIQHLGINTHPRRSTISDANKSRDARIFEQIYLRLRALYQPVLPDSRRKSRKNNLYIFDSTTITLLQEILRGAGRKSHDGQRKGGIKVHTLLHAKTDVPTMLRFSASANNDSPFLNQVRLAAGSVIVFDKAYRDYSTYNQFDRQQITWVTRNRSHNSYRIIERYGITDHQKQQGVKSDHRIELGNRLQKQSIKVKARLVKYKDPFSKKPFEFITNNQDLSPLTIAHYYRQRWQIETFFKRIKQNYPLQYFLGDNENAIKIQIWCSLIADLLLKVIKQGTRSTMAFSNIVGLIRLHLMTYMDIVIFLKSPEKALLERLKRNKWQAATPSLFSP